LEVMIPGPITAKSRIKPRHRDFDNRPFAMT
jgi:hypothetical protein